MSALKVWQKITTGPNTWEVLGVGEDRLRIRVHATGGYFDRYLDIGSEYVARPLRGCSNEEIWEIPSDQMERSQSQVLLYWDTETMQEPIIDMGG